MRGRPGRFLLRIWRCNWADLAGVNAKSKPKKNRLIVSEIAWLNGVFRYPVVYVTGWPHLDSGVQPRLSEMQPIFYISLRHVTGFDLLVKYMYVVAQCFAFFVFEGSIILKGFVTSYFGDLASCDVAQHCLQGLIAWNRFPDRSKAPCRSGSRSTTRSFLDRRYCCSITVGKHSIKSIKCKHPWCDHEQLTGAVQDQPKNL